MLELERRWWDAPLPTSDAGKFELRLEAACRTVRASMEHAVEHRVEALITQLLSSDPRAERVAGLLGVSVRTLHRQLATRGHSFRELSERARQREAALVEQTEEIHGSQALSSAQRARMLGFSGGGALRNALKRWRQR
jgi:AraC-like DNA-binding protein